ncbi:MAG: hypothetical protein HOM94_06330 [Candidatus Marinimicrobia bacterium]|jgi:hypothetical protein|nr:hypothetical protein [Candidatus Neomarinimicrobiota bacterium]MBT4991322.1 hypothetical protein [Candidatus Neomarinimicrobiota bacterium]
MKVKWRKWNNIVHRDVGYLAFGLTLIYAISGVAVNHVSDWNPSYKIENQTVQIEDIWGNNPINQDVMANILTEINLEGPIKSSFMPNPNTLKIFLEKETLTLYLNTKRINIETVSERSILYEMNFLHLNHPKKIWTFMADLFAIVLGLLAITGLFVLKGKKGITGRGAWLTIAGIVIPVLFLILYL